jgi:hypothetical protein
MGRRKKRRGERPDRAPAKARWTRGEVGLALLTVFVGVLELVNEILPLLGR